MRSTISRHELRIILREADVAARRLCRQLRLPRHELDDLRQELLADLIRRLRAFDPHAGTLGAFAGVIVANRAGRIAAKVRNHRRLFGTVPVSLDEVRSDSGETRGALIAEEHGLAAVMGYWVNPISVIERRIDLERSLGMLDDEQRHLVAALSEGSAYQLSRRGLGSRSQLYRQTHEIRLSLMVAGVSAD